MAPISDKRSQASNTTHNTKESAHHAPSNNPHSHAHSHQHSHGHSHHHHGHSHSKENANVSAVTAKSYKTGLEILDFHESWLEEMEYYKEQVCLQKHSQLPAQQQLLSAHNHLHTPYGCHNVANSISQNINALISAASCMDATHQHTVKRRVQEPLAEAPSRSAPRTNNINGVVTSMPTMSAANSQSSWAGDGNKQTINEQLPLKRARVEETASASPNNASNTTQSTAANANTASSKPIAASNAKRSHNAANSTTSAAKGSVAIPAATIAIVGDISAKNGNTTNTQNNAATAANASTASTTTVLINNAPAKSNKIIVNPFHASTLLSAQHQQEDKAKILTQNGLNKTAATAYETSLYASNYLPQANNYQYVSNRVVGGETEFSNSSFMGVYLAKNNGILEGAQHRHHRHGHSHHKHDDDPCAAIDAVSDYTDTDDSDDEYRGDPFFLKGDENKTQQSSHIRLKIEHSSSPSSEESEEDRNTEYYRPKCILAPSIFPNVPPYLNFSSHVQRGPSMPAALHRVLKWKLSPVMPKIVKRVVLNSGFRIIKNTTDWMAIWEKHMKSPGFRTIRSHQKYNHMPGSFRIGRKDSMWRSIFNNVKKFGNKEFGFMQKSYIMPEDLENLRQVWPKNASKLTKWIVKPPASARGTGIKIVNKWSQFPKDRPLVVQKYIERPLLINDNKFDMRIYVLLTSINPLRIYMYKDGLARFASVKYSSELNSLDDRCMHLTNYSINKFSQNYSKNEDFNACQGHKWTLQSLWSCLEKRGVNTKRLWATLRNLVIKAIVSGESGLNRMYRQNVNFRYNCFELFGFDVLLDENIVPWLLEINISPSLHSELPLDLHVKGPLIQAVLNTALYQVPPKLSDKQQEDILTELKLQGPLCYDKRLFTTVLTAEEVRKHNQFTSRSIEFREEYTDAILENLLPDDVRCLVLTEDEFARSQPLERIFPTPDTHMYLKFIENPRYYNRLLDAWEYKYGGCRDKGIDLLSKFCSEEYHLQVSDAALEKEPNVALTEIDMLHAKKSEERIILTTGDDQQPVDNKDKDNVPTVILANKIGTPPPPADAVQLLDKQSTHSAATLINCVKENTAGSRHHHSSRHSTVKAH